MLEYGMSRDVVLETLTYLNCLETFHFHQCEQHTPHWGPLDRMPEIQGEGGYWSIEQAEMDAFRAKCGSPASLKIAACTLLDFVFDDERWGYSLDSLITASADRSLRGMNIKEKVLHVMRRDQP